MIEQHIANALMSATAVTSLVGSSPGIQPLVMPTDATMPQVVYRIISSTSQPTFETAGMNKYRVQIECWGATYIQAVALRDAVNATLDGYQDASMFCYSLSTNDLYENTLLQFICVTEFYVMSSL